MRLERFALLCFSALLPAIVTCRGDPSGPRRPTALSRVGGDGQSAVVGQALSSPIIVKVVDAAGSSMQGVAVTWAIGSGGGSLSPVSSTTDAQGLASATWTLGFVAGQQTAAASLPGTPSIAPDSFTAAAQPGPPAKLGFTVQPSPVTAGVTVNPGVQVTAQDAYGNTVTAASTTVSTAITSGTGTSGAVLRGTLARPAENGVAVFGDLSLTKAGTDYTLTAMATGLTSATSAAFDVTPGTAVRLAVTAQPSAVTAGVVMDPAVQVAVQDSFANTTASWIANVSLAITTGSGTAGAVLSGTRTRAPANGVATFTDLAINKAGNGYTLTALSGALAGTSAPLAVNVGPPARLAFSVQPSAVVAGVTISPAVQVTLLDAGGNLATSATNVITIAVATGPAGASLPGTLSKAAAGGVAAFDDLTATVAGTYSLGATASGLSSATSVSFAVQAGTASTIAKVSGDEQLRMYGAAASPPVVQVGDRFGNAVRSTGQAVRFQVLVGSGKIANSPYDGSAIDTVTVLSDTAGRASPPYWQLGTEIETQTLGASLFGTAVPLVFSATTEGVDRIFGFLSGPTGGYPPSSDPVGLCVRSESQALICGGVSAPPVSLSDLAIANVSACGIGGDGALWCYMMFGYFNGSIISYRNEWRMLGAGPYRSVAATASHSDVSYVSSGQFCALTVSGRPECFSVQGQNFPQPVPTAPRGQASLVTLDVGAGFGCGLGADSLAYCWGGNGVGQLGDSTIVSRDSVAATRGNIRFGALWTGIAYACGRSATGAVFCWGSNDAGDWLHGVPNTLFDAALLGRQTWPWPDTRQMGFAGVAASHFRDESYPAGTATCALSSAGSASCWGMVWAIDRLGFVPTLSVYVVPWPAAFSHVIAGPGLQCGLDVTKHVVCWGGTPQPWIWTP